MSPNILLTEVTVITEGKSPALDWLLAAKMLWSISSIWQLLSRWWPNASGCVVACRTASASLLEGRTQHSESVSDCSVWRYGKIQPEGQSWGSRVRGRIQESCVSRSVSDGCTLISAFWPLTSYLARVLALRKNPHFHRHKMMIVNSNIPDTTDTGISHIGISVGMASSNSESIATENVTWCVCMFIDGTLVFR